MTTRVIVGDVRKALATLEAESVHCVVTSPPYWGLRDYGTEGQLGLEPTPEQYVENMVSVFREVRRALRDDGTLWLNLGDSYAGSMKGWAPNGPGYGGPKQRTNAGSADEIGLKPKDLVGIPWRVAFALQADGWYLRSDIIWAKPNPMPESVTDRPTRSHEYMFLLTKSARYYYDADAVAEPVAASSIARINQATFDTQTGGEKDYGRLDKQSAIGAAQIKGDRSSGFNDRFFSVPPEERSPTRNRRDVWTIATKPFKGAHFATFPPALVEPCILAGTSAQGVCAECGSPYKRVIQRTKHPERDMEAQRAATAAVTGRSDGHVSGPEGMVDLVETVGWKPSCAHATNVVPAVVLDPFAGSGTVGMVAKQHGRNSVLIELNADYVPLIKKRLKSVSEPVKPIEAVA